MKMDPQQFDETWLCRLYRSIGNNYYYLSDFEMAMKFVKLSQQYAVASGNHMQEAITLNILGMVLLEKSCLLQAVETFDLGKSVLGKIPVQRENEAEIKQTKSHLLTNLGLVHFTCGNAKKAAIYFEETLKIAQSIGDIRSTAFILINLNNCYVSMKRFQDALDCINQAERLWGVPGLQLKLKYFEANISQRWAMHTIDPTQKQIRLKKAADIFDEIIEIGENTEPCPDPNVLFIVFFQYSAIKCMSEKQTAAAAANIRKGIDIAQKFGLKHFLGASYSVLALILNEEKKYEDAIDYRIGSNNYRVWQSDNTSILDPMPKIITAMVA